jgi:hypothetical protein
MVLNLRSQGVAKSLLEISGFNLSRDFVGVLKTNFGELKKRFLKTAPIHILCYIQNFLECLEVCKYVFILNMILIHVPLFC